jgi:hypothetical protein
VAYYCLVAHAERSTNNGIRVQLELLNDPDPDILGYFDITVMFPPDGTNAEKRLALRAQVTTFIDELIARRTNADSNAAATISQLIGLRYPSA